MNDPRIEEVLEDLYLQHENHGRVPRPAPEATLRAACEAGLITLNAEGTPAATANGMEEGKRVVRRHRLAECLLRDVLQVTGEEAEADACSFEHILRPGLEDKICTLLGHPPTCPDGHPIPRGECCLKAEQDKVQEVGPLCDGRAGQTGVVAYLSTRDNREIQKLMAMGILPGSDIRLVRLFPSYIFEVGQSQFTVDQSLAEKIFVHWQE
jgi:DtxR family transcriptional regulator, Mn-dependent transcriptional regulator